MNFLVSKKIKYQRINFDTTINISSKIKRIFNNELSWMVIGLSVAEFEILLYYVHALVVQVLDLHSVPAVQ